ncbi:MAG TPA: hypothetical protein VH394_26510 [Thermoanaerobaculia bacterium]|jgi:hypothetical protein|nr:hypothetical protein [Thermoanaerobaculia bacterium]
MLPLERCREILGEDAPEDERELEKARDDAHRLARLLLEMYRAEKTKKREAELAEDPEI